jgi:hypothetical protein
MAKRKRTNNDLQNIHIKLKIEKHESYKKSHMFTFSFYNLLFSICISVKQLVNGDIITRSIKSWPTYIFSLIS